MKQAIDAIELLSSAHVTGEAVAGRLRAAGRCDVTVTRLEQDGAATEFLSIVIPGADDSAPQLASSAAWAASAPVRRSRDWCRTAMAPWWPSPSPSSSWRWPRRATCCPARCASARTSAARGHAACAAGADDALALSHARDDGARGRPAHGRDPVGRHHARQSPVNQRGVALTPVAKQGYLLRMPETMLDLLGWVSGIAADAAADHAGHRPTRTGCGM